MIDGTVNQLIPIHVSKGCVLYLTPTEYANGIARGKRIRRRRTFHTRLAQRSQPSRPGPAPLFDQGGLK